MTIKELYEWAKEHNAVDLDITVRYENGMFYYSFEPKVELIDDEPTVLLD